MSELFAQIIDSSIRGKYLSKDKWNNLEIDRYNQYLTLENSYVNKMDYYYNSSYDTLVCKKISDEEFIIPNGNYIIWDLWLEIEILDNNIDYAELTKFIIIKLFLNNSKTTEVGLGVNLIFASLLEKQVYINDQSNIMIPIIIFDILNGKPFPMNAISLTQIKICFYNYEPNFEYMRYKSLTCRSNKYNAPINLSTMWFVTIFNETIFKLGDCINLTNFTKLLLFSFFRNNGIVHPSIESMELILNSIEPGIKFESMLGEIMEFEIYDNTYYMISLTPDVKNKDDVEKMIKKSGTNYEDNLLYNHNYGINLSRVDHIKINFNMDIEQDDLFCRCISVNLNLLCFSYGLCRLRYYHS